MARPTELIRRLEDSVGRALVGKPDVVRLAVVGLLARGHLLIEDVPGVGKTTLAAALARSIGAWQIMLINNRRLPAEFHVSRLNTWLLWISVVTGFGGVGYWLVTVFPKELCKAWKILC